MCPDKHSNSKEKKQDYKSHVKTISCKLKNQTKVTCDSASKIMILCCFNKFTMILF